MQVFIYKRKCPILYIDPSGAENISPKGVSLNTFQIDFPAILTRYSSLVFCIFSSQKRGVCNVWSNKERAPILALRNKGAKSINSQPHHSVHAAHNISNWTREANPGIGASEQFASEVSRAHLQCAIMPVEITCSPITIINNNRPPNLDEWKGCSTKALKIYNII
jgi:hypothetical protein